MSYTSGEALVLARLQAIAGGAWTSTNTARGKWSQLDSGAADHYAVLRMGAFTSDPLTGGTEMNHWSTVIELWQSYRDDGTSYTNLLGYVEAILDQFNAYRKLGDTTGTVSDSSIDRGDEIEEMWTKGGGVRWLRQRLYVSWSEENPVTYAE